ncbi:hypothetical protein [Ideonella sp.]|uniref:hypothetical protein n=1 Tax=Ideonella sp. TaxID=1929293 RepID=UPI0035ADC56F
MIRPTRLTAALAGAFSAGAWPWLWPLLSDPAEGSSVQLILGMLLLVALPAHLFVIGATGSPGADGRRLDGALLQRIAAWLIAAAAVAGALAVYRAVLPAGQPA